jgi:hypothetical protein
MLLRCLFSSHIHLRTLCIRLLLPLRILLLCLCLCMLLLLLLRLCSLLHFIHLLQSIQCAMHLLNGCLQILQQLRVQCTLCPITNSILELCVHA